MNRDRQLELYQDFIINCTNNAKSVKNYSDFKRINECLKPLFPGKKDISILDFDDPVEFEKAMNKLFVQKQFIDYDKAGKNQYSNTIKHYLKFLYAKKMFSKYPDLVIIDGLKESYTEEELKSILLEYLERENVGHNPTPFISFGFEFGDSFINGNINVKKFIHDAGITTANADYYLGMGVDLYKATYNKIYGIRFGTTRISDSYFNIKDPLQQIFYGAPGTGKSHEIKEKTKGDDSVIRTTFHPDSDYSTFVGCYKPTMGNPKPIYGFDATGKTVKVEDPKGTIIKERKIEYEFVPQAFTKAYVQAWKKMCNINHIKSIPVGASVVGNAKSPYEKTDFIGTNSSFNYKEKGAKLTDDEKEALVKVDNFDFPFDGIHSFGELHDELTVIVTDKPTEEQSDRYYKEITLSAEQIRELYRLFIENRDTFGFLESILSKILLKLKWSWHPDLDKLKDYNGNDITIEVRESNQLLGLYDSETKMVYLFKNNIRGNIDLLRAVYIHEMFHAYFHSQELYIPEIEEPIVECCALCFLELFDNKICETYKASVKRKQQSSAICYYGFGSVLFEHRNLDWMKLYQNGLNNVDASSSIVKEYTNKFSPIYPFDDEQKTMDLLYNILTPQSNTKQDKSAQFLIIEEINRGNCAQIFGDLFQLLDRNEYDYSEYPIVADDDLKKVLAEEFKNLNLDALKQEIDAVFKENYPNGITDKILNGELLVLPKNLYIWATMNTSDQSLFPIDSAFKRRWEWKYMPIGYKNKDWTIKIGEKEYKWVDFQRTINDKIYSVDNSEDKQLGDFFVDANRTGTNISADTLLNKILFYIWNDVCKDDPDQIFRWKDYKDDKEKSIRFSDFFDNDRDKKLQGLMCFLKVNAIGESEETNETEPSLTTEESEMSENSVEKDDEVTP